jgi:hypothetical protein
VALVCFERGDIDNVARHAGPGSAGVAPREKPRRHLDQLRAQALAAACDEEFGRALEILGDPSDLPVTPFELGRTLLLIGGLR